MIFLCFPLLQIKIGIELFIFFYVAFVKSFFLLHVVYRL